MYSFALPLPRVCLCHNSKANLVKHERNFPLKNWPSDGPTDFLDISLFNFTAGRVDLMKVNFNFLMIQHNLY